MRNSLSCTNICSAGAFVLALSAASPVRAATVDYTALPTQTVLELTSGRVTVTASEVVHNLFNNGLGVVGGWFDDTVDGVEYLTFNFATPALNITYSVTAAFGATSEDVGLRTLEAFGVGGVSLGEVEQVGMGR